MDDLSSRLNELFSSPEGMDRIKSLVSMLSGSGAGGPPQEEKKQEASSGGINDLPFDPSMLLKIKSAMELMNKGDPRVDLLLALKPNLSEPKRRRIDEAIHLMRLINLMPLLREQGFL